jgi:putative FmdB family regulatory protein
MPTYEYACKSCGEHVEVVQSFRDDPLTECPACGGPLRKVFAPVGIVLKGSGFYKTDSRATSKPSAKSDSGSSSDKSAKSEKPEKSEKKSETKSESSSATKSDTKKSETKSA